jgi:thioredoxin-like negative regulator of GroEL
MAIATNEILTLTDKAGLDDALDTDLPVLLLVYNGESLRADVRTEMETAATQYVDRIDVFKVDASKDPSLAEFFELGKHPVLIGWFNGQVLARRPRPWNTDVKGMVEVLLTHAPAATEDIKKPALIDKPVNVTDKTFQQEVLGSDLPVLVLDKLAVEYAGKVKITKVDVDANPGLSQAFRVMSIPTLMFAKNGKIVGQEVGALPEHILRSAIEQLIALNV